MIKCKYADGIKKLFIEEEFIMDKIDYNEESLDDIMKLLFDMLDEGIDDYEKGKFVSEEELFEELKSIKSE